MKETHRLLADAFAHELRQLRMMPVGDVDRGPAILTAKVFIRTATEWLDSQNKEFDVPAFLRRAGMPWRYRGLGLYGY